MRRCGVQVVEGGSHPSPADEVALAVGGLLCNVNVGVCSKAAVINTLGIGRGAGFDKAEVSEKGIDSGKGRVLVVHVCKGGDLSFGRHHCQEICYCFMRRD